MRPISTHARRGFTLLELTIVIGVIVVLLLIVVSASRKAFSGQEEKATKNLLTSLDRALSEYITVASTIPKYDPMAYQDVPSPDVVPGDGANRQGGAGFKLYPAGGIEHPIRPDAAVFIRQARGYGEVDSIINGLDQRLLQTTITATSGTAADPTPSVVDTWAVDDAQWKAASYALTAQQFIYYIHPENPLGQDLFGKCVNGRPYFMSAGPDRKYGLTREFPDLVGVEAIKAAEKAMSDNIYSYKPGPFRKDMNER